LDGLIQLLDRGMLLVDRLPRIRNDVDEQDVRDLQAQVRLSRLGHSLLSLGVRLGQRLHHSIEASETPARIPAGLSLGR
jgi:hypothetical protein